MAELREAREDPNYGKDLMQVAQVMIFCGLPCQKTEAREITRQARMGNGRLRHGHIQGNGAGDRHAVWGRSYPFHWMTQQAVLTKDPFIPLSSASQFLNDMDMSTGGPKIKRVREAFERVSAMAIVVERRHEGSMQRVIMPLVRVTNPPDTLRTGEQMQLLDAPAREKNRLERDYGFRILPAAQVRRYPQPSKSRVKWDR